jgi:hypothetical protein
MAAPLHTHSFTIGGTAFTGFAEPYTPKADETTPEEALTVKGWWILLVDSPHASISQEAVVEDVETSGGTAIEAGPLYVRQVKPYISGLPTDHVEIIAVAYREEA